MTQSPPDRCRYEQTSDRHAKCCYRRAWGDHDRCVWHAAVDEDIKKPVEELQATRETLENRRLNQGDRSADLAKKRRLLFKLGADDGSTVLRPGFLKTQPAELLNDAQLQGVQLQSVDLLENCRLIRADLAGATLVEATLTGADLRFADLTNARLGGTDLTNADLRSTTLIDANLWNAVLADACLRGADLTSAELVRTTLTDADLKNVTLANANLQFADLTDASLRDADLTSANLEGATLNQANFVRTTLLAVDLSNTLLLGTNLEGANLTRADLSRCTLYGAQLFDTRLLDVAINDRTKFSDVCIYEQWADPIIDRHLNQATIAPREAGYIDRSTDEIDEERLRQYMSLAIRTASVLEDHVQRTQQGSRGHFKQFGSTVIREMTRFWRHRQLSSEDAHQAIGYSDRSISVYRSRQRLYRENSLPEGVPNPYVREKHVRRKRAFIRGDWLNWLKYVLSRWIMLYGESPWRVVGNSVALVVLLGVVYPLLGGVSVRTRTLTDTFFNPVLFAGRIPEAIGVLFTNLYFSAVTFTTLGYGGMQPARPATQLLASVESLLGGVMIALLVTVLGRRVMR